MPAKKRPAKPKVLVYSTDYCPWCIKAKEFLHENKITFTSINVGTSTKAAQEMIKKSGQQGVPVIDARGAIIVGFDERAVRKALGMKPKKFKLW
ncbi:MAG: glutaredoxin domain-containing protein [Nanoarchaeota archaeon]